MLEGRWVIPRSWSWVQAKDISTIVGGGTPSTTDKANFSNQGIPWLTPSDLSNYKLPYVETGKRDISQKGFQSSGARLLPKGTVLFTSRAPIGYCVISLNEITTNQGFKNLILDDKIRPEYIRYYLLNSKDYAESLASGSTFKEISGKKTGELKIPLPPLNEQRRIVSTIEQLTARSNKARTVLEDVPKLIAQFRQSVLAAAFRGDLTADWREKNPDIEPASELLERIKIDRRDLWEKRQLEKMNIQGKSPVNDKWKEKYREPDLPITSSLPEIPNSWHWVKLISILLEVGDVDHKMPKAQEKGVPYISTRDFIDTEIINFEGAKKISEEDFISLCRKIYPEQGDLLLSRYGTVGEVRIVSTEQPFQASYSIAILKKVSEKLNKFIAIGLTSKPLQDQIKIWTRGAAQPDLGLAHIKEFAFPIPPEQEQQEILIRIEAAMNSIDKIEREYKEMKGELNQLDRSILAKAFRGELVPQDPNDEPAAVLLARIRAAREQTSTLKQHGKTTRKNSSKQLSIDGLE